MGAGASASSVPAKYAAELEKPLDAADCADDGAAKAEVTRLRALLKSYHDESAAAAGGVAADTENGNSHIAELIAATGPVWAEMNAKGSTPAEGVAMDVGFIADQDQDSKTDDGSGWASVFATGQLRFADGKYAFSMEGEDVASRAPGAAPRERRSSKLVTTEGDKSERGAEYSLLEWFGGKLITACDRTGNLDEVLPHPDWGTEKQTEKFQVQPVLDASGTRVKLMMGDGKKPKPLKCEWSTMLNGKLVIGSTGKERTDDDGNVVHQGEMWVKVLDEGFGIAHEDWGEKYTALRAADAAKCPHGAGYMIHESGRWSEAHQRWFFIPRKLSREAYDEVKDEKKCVNLMLSCDADFKAMAATPILTYLELRGCSDFFFIPGTNDTHLFLTRTEETIEGTVSTYASVIDLSGATLMDEIQFAVGHKFEGTCLLGEFFAKHNLS